MVRSLAMRAVVDNMIRIPLEDLPDEAWEAMYPMFMLPNHEKDMARREKRYGWTEMPDHIQLWDADEQHLIDPRGFPDPLENGFQ